MDGMFGATKQTNSNPEFYTKGECGERAVAKAINELGFNILFVGGAVKYKIDKTKFCTVDLLPYGSGESYFVQVKHKQRRKYYPDTGLEVYQWNNLLWHQEQSGIRVVLIFVEDGPIMYGGFIDELKNCISPHGDKFNHKDNRQMIYFLIEKMKPLNQIFNHVTIRR